MNAFPSSLHPILHSRSPQTLPISDRSSPHLRSLLSPISSLHSPSPLFPSVALTSPLPFRLFSPRSGRVLGWICRSSPPPPLPIHPRSATVKNTRHMACSDSGGEEREPTQANGATSKPRILLAASGSVASIKFGNLCHSFCEWAEVRAIATKASLHFIDRAALPKDVILYIDEDEWSSWNTSE